MTKAGRATRARGLRSPVPSARAGPQRPLDSQHIAAEIVAALADAVIVTGLDRRALLANRAAADLFGRPLEDLPGTPIDDLVAAGERALVAEHEQLAFHGEEQHYETKIVSASGEERVVAVSTTPLMVEGELIGAVATLRSEERRVGK